MTEIKITTKQIKPLLEKLQIVESLDKATAVYLKFQIDNNLQLIIDDGVGEALKIKQDNYKNTWMKVTPPEVRRNQCWSDIMQVLFKNGITQTEVCEALNKPNCVINKYNCHAKTPRPGTLKRLVSIYIFKVKDLNDVKFKYKDILDENNTGKKEVLS